MSSAAATTEVPQTPPTAKFLVRHGAMRFLGEFDAPPELGLSRLDRVVVKTERGQETGDVLCPSTPEALAALPDATTGTVLRRMTAEDSQREEHLRQLHGKEFERGRELIASHRL